MSDEMKPEVGVRGNSVLKDIYPFMQQLRNSHGPRWLAAYLAGEII